jgi:translation initiation factor 3 subunit H
MKASNLDGNIVGWFQSSVLGSYINETTVEIQYDYQSQNPNSVLVIADASSSSSPIKALRLTQEYLAFHRTMRDRQSQGPATLITGGPVTFNTGTMTVFEEVPIKVDLSVLDEAFLFENRAKLSVIESRSSVQQDAVAATVQLLMECVEDLAIEKVRFAQLTAGKAPVGSATRLRGEDELKRLQSANGIILLTENVRLLNEIVEATAKSNKTTCEVFDVIRK